MIPLPPSLRSFHEAHKERTARLYGLPPQRRRISRALPKPEPVIEPERIEVAPPAPIIPASVHVIRFIQRRVASEYGFEVSDLTGESRRAKYVEPRHLAMYLASVIAKRSLPYIGRKFGNRDHTTALHAIRKTEATIARDPEFAERVSRIRTEIEAACVPAPSEAA